MLQLVASVLVVVIGLAIALLGDAPDDVQMFGWFIAAIGVLGLGARAAITRRGNGDQPGPPR